MDKTSADLTVKKENIMGTMPEGKLLFTMAMPMVISMLVQALYNIFDSLVVAGYSSYGVTALSLSFPMQNLMIAFATGTGVGINSYLSRSLGQKDRKAVNAAAGNGLFVIFLTNIAFVLIGLFLVRPYFTFLTDAQPGSLTYSYGVDYLTVVTAASAGLFFQVTFERLLQSTGKAKYSMYSQGTGALVNILLDPIFILSPGEQLFGVTMPFGLGLGPRGAAIATVIGQFVAAGFGLFANLKYNKEIEFSFRALRPDRTIIKKIYAVGLPSIFMAAVGSFLTVALNKILTLGEQITYVAEKGLSAAEAAALAAKRLIGVSVYGVYFKLQSFIFMPVFGMNNGMIPIVAYNYGARSRKRIMKTVRYAVTAAMVYMLIGFAVFQFASGALLKAFYQAPAAPETAVETTAEAETQTKDGAGIDAPERQNDDLREEILRYGVPAMRIISMCFLFAGVCVITISSLQALGMGMPSLVISLVRQIAVILPLSYLFAKLFGLVGIFWAFPIAEFIALCISAYLFLRAYKKLIKPLDGPTPSPQTE
ncbi:MAG: polysaccharide biosynthesis C-terminal domain-containing protein [Clostridia bacterium]|nr:polysaccharide biosynthesis C-terminal domain-containing protein [Clostridia bacterium]